MHYYDYQLSKARQSFHDNVLALKYYYGIATATFLVSNGNDIVAYNFVRFPANDVKG